jgi:hypothetical protein
MTPLTEAVIFPLWNHIDPKERVDIPMKLLAWYAKRFAIVLKKVIVAGTFLMLFSVSCIWQRRPAPIERELFLTIVEDTVVYYAGDTLELTISAQNVDTVGFPMVLFENSLSLMLPTGDYFVCPTPCGYRGGPSFHLADTVRVEPREVIILKCRFVEWCEDGYPKQASYIPIYRVLLRLDPKDIRFKSRSDDSVVIIRKARP